MNRKEIKLAYESSGWETAGRSDEEVVRGEAGRYTVSTHESLWQAAGLLFELRDNEHGIRVGVRRVPRPSRAAELLEHYGIPVGPSTEVPVEPPTVPLEEEM